MADQVVSTGRLVAIDGSRGNDVVRIAESLAAEVRQHSATCVISRWDASGLFGELAQAELQHRHISARTLALVYAADLAFRLKWEIRPALLAGHVVIAAPYLDTAVTLGVACGLSETWLRDILRFAPEEDVRGVSRERKPDRGWKRRLDRGYPECCAALLESADPSFKIKRTRSKMIKELQGLGGRKAWDLSRGGIEDTAKAIVIITGNPPASSSRAVSRPGTPRKRRARSKSPA